MTTMTSVRPTPPDGTYPHWRLCDHRGMAPKSAMIKITIKIVPSIVFSPICKFSPRNSDTHSQQRSGFPTNFASGLHLLSITALDERLVQVETNGNAIARISAVVQIIAITVVVHVYVIAVVPIA